MDWKPFQNKQTRPPCDSANNDRGGSFTLTLSWVRLVHLVMGQLSVNTQIHPYVSVSLF